MATTPEHAPHIPHLRLPDIRGGFRWANDNSLTLGLALAIAAGGTYFIASHDQKPPIKPTTGVSDTFKPPESEFVVVPAIPTEIPPTATASPTPEPPKPTPTEAPLTPTAEPTKTPPTPEAKKDVPCTIVPEKYCSQGELIYTKNYLGQPEIYVGFHIPANEPIFAGKDGQALKAKIGQPSALQGLLVTIIDPNLGDPNATAYTVVGDLRLDSMSTVNVKKEDIIGYTQDTGIKNFGDYNLIVTIRRLDPSVGHAVPAEDLLRELFPEAFAKAVKTVDYQGPDKPAPTILSPVFASGK